LTTLVDKILKVLCADRRHVRDTKHEANGIEDVRFTTAVQASDGVERFVPALRDQSSPSFSFHHHSLRSSESHFCPNEGCVPSRDHRTHGVRFEALTGISARTISGVMRLTSMTISVILMVLERRSAAQSAWDRGKWRGSAIVLPQQLFMLCPFGSGAVAEVSAGPSRAMYERLHFH
jgi:hypothetical protein